ncbi:hypothetical protein IMG5_067410, partial [Ichthyophthirius multifiliis]
MSDTDPRNPYGYNYEEFEYESKVFYKYQQIKKYIHFIPEDQEKVTNANFIYIGGMFLATLCSLGSGYLIRSSYIFKNKIIFLHKFIQEYPKIYYG